MVQFEIEENTQQEKVGYYMPEGTYFLKILFVKIAVPLTIEKLSQIARKTLWKYPKVVYVVEDKFGECIHYFTRSARAKKFYRGIGEICEPNTELGDIAYFVLLI